jgi:hypothetical protein
MSYLIILKVLHFEDWLKKVGYASEYIVKKAAEEGTQVHNFM